MTNAPSPLFEKEAYGTTVMMVAVIGVWWTIVSVMVLMLLHVSKR